MKKIVLVMLIFAGMSSVVYAGGWFQGASSWAEPELYDAKENGIVGESDFLDNIGGYSNKITRTEFAKLIMNLYEQMTGNLPAAASSSTFTDTTDENVLRAYNVGIISGKGNGHFAPNDFITRQEMAIMMSRALDSMNIDYNKGDGVLTVSDKSQVASWAKAGVDFAYEEGFMKGDGVNFSPKANTPIDQAVVIVNRVFEKYHTQKKKEIVASDYTKGYILNNYDGRLNITYKNNEQTVMVEPNGVVKADFSDTANSKYYYLKSGIIWVKNLKNNKYSKTISGNPYKDGLATDFVVAKGGPYDGYIAIKYANKSNYMVYKNDSSLTLQGEISSVNDLNYEIGEMYDEIEAKKYQFAITVTDPSQNMKNAKFTEDNMYFFSAPSHYDEIKDKKGYLRMTPRSNDAAYCGPIGRVGDKSSQWTFNGYGGIYQTDIKFFNNIGNAGIVFNLKYAGDKNDNFAGYYAGIDVQNNKVIFGKGSYGKWTRISSKELGYDVSTNDTVTLKVMKNGNEISVYVNNKLYITANDDTYNKNGGFGIRTYKTDASYSNYTINPLPY